MVTDRAAPRQQHPSQAATSASRRAPRPRGRSRRCCGSPACRARASPPSPTWWRKLRRAGPPDHAARRRQRAARAEPRSRLHRADRVENMRRVGEVAKLFVDAGLIVPLRFISPFRAEARAARDRRRASSWRSSSTRRWRYAGARSQGPVCQGRRGQVRTSPASTSPMRCRRRPTWCCARWS